MKINKDFNKMYKDKKKYKYIYVFYYTFIHMCNGIVDSKKMEKINSKVYMILS